MRLSDRDKQILSAINLDAGATHADIGKRIGAAPHAVRYAVQRLTVAGVIARRWLVDSYALGWFRCVFFISTKLSDRATKSRLRKFLSIDSRTAYVAELGGEHDFLVSVFARDMGDVERFEEDICLSFGQIIESKSLSFRTQVSFYSRFSLRSGNRKRDSVTFSTKKNIEVLDSVDWKIVTILGAASDQSHRDLANLAKLPLSTFEYRLDGLKDRQIVLGQCYAVNPSVYGAKSYIISFFSRGFATNLRDALASYAQKNSYVVAFLSGVGEWDFDFDVEVDTSDQVQTIKEDLSEHFRSHLREIRVTPVFGLLKMAFFPQGTAETDRSR